MNLFAALKDECVDTVFADPPFNLGKDYGAGAGSDELKTEDYLRWCYSWMDEAVRLVRPGGAIFIYNLPQWAYHLAARLESTGMNFRLQLVDAPTRFKLARPRGGSVFPKVCEVEAERI